VLQEARKHIVFGKLVVGSRCAIPDSTPVAAPIDPFDIKILGHLAKVWQ
jgi:hypothetical protein